MTSILQSSSTGFSIASNPGNSSGGQATIKAAGRVNNAEQNNATKALERDGRLNLSQFGLIKLPRETLFLQDIQSSRVKATRQGNQVQSSSKADSDEDRQLNKVKAATDRYHTVDPIQDRNGGQSEKDHSDKESELPAIVQAEKSVVGQPNTIYRTLQNTPINTRNGQQLSLLA